MSRSIKDLRELVCVSRLTMREDEDDEDLSRPLTSLSLFEKSPVGSQTSVASLEYPSLTGEDRNNNNNAGRMSSADILAKKKCPLPPVRSNSRPSSGERGLKVDSGKASFDERQGFYDNVLQCIGDDSTSDWLMQANQEVAKLRAWCQEGENFDFSDFWLTEFALSKQVSLLKLEIGIILEEIAFSLGDAINQKKLHDSDVKGLFSSLFAEYPQKLCSPRGQYIFLNILDTLSSGRDERYRRLLTDVRMSTSQSSLAQKALAIRAYIVISIWGNIVEFYRKVKNEHSLDRGKSPQKQSGDRNRLFQAVRSGRVRVLHYLLRNSFGSPGCTDVEGRSLAFLSVLHNQPQVLKYLMAKHPVHLSLAEPFHSGNTCVHVAANLNHLECLQLLLESGEVDVNQRNLQCEGATPLHLAVMQGNKESVELLLKAGADSGACMNGVSPWQLADQLGQEDMKLLLQ